MKGKKVGGGFGCEHESAIWPGWQRARDTVFVGVGDRGVILRQQGEDDGRRSRGQVVDMPEAEWADDDSQKDGREEGSVGKSGDDERLPTSSV